LLTKKVPEQAGVEVVGEEEQQRVGELEGRGELQQQLVQHVQELQEHRRALVGQALRDLAVTAAIYATQVHFFHARTLENGNNYCH